MRVLINAFGTEGDIRPSIALARGLVAAGHDAAICTPTGYADLVVRHGVEHLAMDNHALQVIQTGMTSMRGPADGLRMAGEMRIGMRQMMLDEWRAAQAWRPDTIVFHPKCLGALHVAERLDIPAFIALPLPFFTPTTAFPIPFVSRRSLGSVGNRASYLANHATMLMYGSMINTFRTDVLGLRRRRRTDDLLRRHDGTPLPALYSHSPHLVPRPVDYPDHAHITGAWTLDADTDWEPPTDLVEFLAAGEPPVFVGFGSMGFGRGADRRTESLVSAITERGRRVILATGWGGVAAATDSTQIHSVGAVPHDWLFPRTEAVVHHGGSGTTHAGLGAGRPSLICPFLGDQPFWGNRVHDTGAGPAPIPSRKIDSSRLRPAVDQLLNDPALRERAARLGREISGEDGVATAVRIIAENRPEPVGRTTD